MSRAEKQICLLWHMHQPSYLDPRSGEPLLPWVRLHAAAGYLDMARALERHPEVRVTVNLVPSLVEQLEKMLAGAKDPLERLAERPTDTLSASERALLLGRCFSVRWDKAIAPRPRYAALLAKRGHDADAAALAAAAARFSDAELRDLQCLFQLAWLGWAAREEEPEALALEEKGRDFSEAEKAAIGELVRRAAGKVLPAWRALAARGQVELCASPYYHPIVPLLCDSDAAHRSRPRDRLPPRFVHPEDARAQIAAALEAHRQRFGAAPAGMWPPEGSLSPEAVTLYGKEGVRWLAGDEGVLARSLDGWSGPGAPRSHAFEHAGVALVFRDRELSDRIGFRYAGVPAADAAEDLVSAALASADGGGLCGLFLDGENAWESYDGRGRDFLDAFYGRLETLAQQGRAAAVTIGEALAERTRIGLSRLHAGSWIDADFHIWIGDPVKNRAWSLLGAARDRLHAEAERRGADAPAVAEARRHLMVAEGSDWFWWFGEPFSSVEDSLFDELYRANLAAAWRALGDEPPAALAAPVGQGLAALRPRAPTAFVSPRMNGRRSYFEWQGAARIDIAPGQVMAGEINPVAALLVGFDLQRLYVCLDPTRESRRQVAAAHATFHARTGERETVLRIDLGAADGGPAWRQSGGHIGAADVVELSIPFASLGASPRDELYVWVTLDFAGVVFARVPEGGAAVVQVPWEGWDGENWSV